MWILRAAVLLAVATAAFCGPPSPATINALELKKLELALLKWKTISSGSTGYIVQQHHHQEKSKAPLLHFVDMASGSVQRVCPIAAVTVAPTTQAPKSFPVKIIHKVEEMFAMLKRILQRNLCKIVKIVYSKDKAYPIIARLAGCKNPAMDAIAELGSILLAPKTHTSSPVALCTFAMQHLPKQPQEAVAFAQQYLRFGTLLPTMPKAKAASLPARLSTRVSASSALEEAKKALVDELKPHKAEIAKTMQAIKAGARRAELKKKTLHKLLPGLVRERPAQHHEEPVTGQLQDGAADAWVADETGFGDGLDDGESESYSDDSDSMPDSLVHSTGTAGPAEHGGSHHHHHRRHGGWHHSGRRLKRALFYSGCGLLGLGIVLVVARSVSRSCRAKKQQSKTKKVDAINYSALVEDDVLESRPPVYAAPAHGIAAPVEC